MSESTKEFNDPDEVLHRQVHPQHIQDQGPTSVAFRPSSRDEGKLSVDRDSLSSAEQAYKLHIQKINPENQQNLKSAGTWSVSVAECLDLELPPISDPIGQPEPNRAHCLIEFTEHSRNQSKKRAKKLRDNAVSRGATFSPGQFESG